MNFIVLRSDAACFFFSSFSEEEKERARSGPHATLLFFTVDVLEPCAFCSLISTSA